MLILLVIRRVRDWCRLCLVWAVRGLGILVILYRTRSIDTDVIVLICFGDCGLCLISDEGWPVMLYAADWFGTWRRR